MANGPVSTVLQHLRKLEALASAGRLSDGQLLQRFIGDRDEAAFNALLQRHGPMVWSVCRRVLRCDHHAEDVFQATFLVLARKAASVRKQQSVASWLYGVAYRLSRQLWRRECRRPVPEASSPEDPSQDPGRRLDMKELQTVLDEELHRLGEQYRMPLVLCFLEGMTRDEAAEHLGWSVSTLKRRLDKGREVLRGRLDRRGVTLSGALLSAALTQDLAAATVPATLLVPTIKAALLVAAGRAVKGIVRAQVVALTEGVFHAMMMTKFKIAVVLMLAVVTIGAGVGFYAGRGGTAQGAGSPGGTVAPAPSQKQDDKEALQRKLDRLEKELQEARDLAEALRAKAEVERQRAQAAEARAVAERDLAQAMMLQAKAKAEYVLPAKLKVRLTDADPVSVKASRLPVELAFQNQADKDVTFVTRDMRFCLLNKNGESVYGGLLLHDLENKQFLIKGGKGETTVVAPRVSLESVVRPGEDYFLVVFIGHQWGMVRFSTKE
jgi:RNA polymerase sigma factor (sigma-70 family)